MIKKKKKKKRTKVKKIQLFFVNFSFLKNDKNLKSLRVII